MNSIGDRQGFVEGLGFHGGKDWAENFFVGQRAAGGNVGENVRGDVEAFIGQWADVAGEGEAGVVLAAFD